MRRIVLSSKDQELVIEAGKSEQRYWQDIWAFRGLFYFLAWRDFLVRYKQTVVGVAWSVVRPVLTMLIFKFVFGRLANVDSGGVPYPIFVFAALLPWQFFATALAECSNSLVVNANLVSKVYFPRLIVPASSIIVALVDFGISCLILAALMAFYGFVPGPGVFLLPLLVVFTFLASMGAGLWFAALNVRYRDFRHIVPFVVQLGLYISPVGFPRELVPDHLLFWYSLNPMVGVIDIFRWAILGSEFSIYWPGFWCSIVLVAALLMLGIRYFRKTERTFADVI